MKRMIDNKEFDIYKNYVDELKNIATKVEANPTLEGTEASLTGLQVGDTKYAVPQGTSVEANPLLVGGETSLASIQIGNTKYVVGKKLYNHKITIFDSGAYCINLEIICDSETALFSDISGFLTWLNTNNYKQNKPLQCSGYGYWDSALQYVMRVYYASASSLGFSFVNGTSSLGYLYDRSSVAVGNNPEIKYNIITIY